MLKLMKSATEYQEIQYLAEKRVWLNNINMRLSKTILQQNSTAKKISESLSTIELQIRMWSKRQTDSLYRFPKAFDSAFSFKLLLGL